MKVGGVLLALGSFFLSPLKDYFRVITLLGIFAGKGVMMLGNMVLRSIVRGSEVRCKIHGSVNWS